MPIPQFLPTDLVAPVPIRVELIPATNRNRPQLPIYPRSVTIHETGNTRPGANAAAHAIYFRSAAQEVPSSVHFVVDDREIIQLLPLTERAWHAGDGPTGPGNLTSVSLEMCVNSDGNLQRTRENAARLTAALLHVLNLLPDDVVPHRHWANTACPALMTDADIARFRSRVREFYYLIRHAGFYFPETGKTIAPEFREHYVRYGSVLVFGYPISDPMYEDGLLVQYFERAVLEYHPENPPDWRVLGRRIGAQLFEEKRRKEG